MGLLPPQNEARGGLLPAERKGGLLPPERRFGGLLPSPQPYNIPSRPDVPGGRRLDSGVTGALGDRPAQMSDVMAAPTGYVAGGARPLLAGAAPILDRIIDVYDRTLEKIGSPFMKLLPEEIAGDISEQRVKVRKASAEKAKEYYGKRLEEQQKYAVAAGSPELIQAVADRRKHLEEMDGEGYAPSLGMIDLLVLNDKIQAEAMKHQESTFGKTLGAVTYGLGDFTVMFAAGGGIGKITAPAFRRGFAKIAKLPATQSNLWGKGLDAFARHHTLPAYMGMVHLGEAMAEDPNADPGEYFKAFSQGVASGGVMAGIFTGIGWLPPMPLNKGWQALTRKMPKWYDKRIFGPRMEQIMTQAPAGALVFGGPTFMTHGLQAAIPDAVSGAMWTTMMSNPKAVKYWRGAELTAKQYEATRPREMKVFAPKTAAEMQEMAAPWAKEFVASEMGLTKKEAEIVVIADTKRYGIESAQLDGGGGNRVATMNTAREMYQAAMKEPWQFNEEFLGWLGHDHGYTRVRYPEGGPAAEQIIARDGEGLVVMPLSNDVGGVGPLPKTDHRIGFPVKNLTAKKEWVGEEGGDRFKIDPTEIKQDAAGRIVAVFTRNGKTYKAYLQEVPWKKKVEGGKTTRTRFKTEGVEEVTADDRHAFMYHASKHNMLFQRHEMEPGVAGKRLRHFVQNENQPTRDALPEVRDFALARAIEKVTKMKVGDGEGEVPLKKALDMLLPEQYERIRGHLSIFGLDPKDLINADQFDTIVDPMTGIELGPDPNSPKVKGAMPITRQMWEVALSVKEKHSRGPLGHSRDIFENPVYTFEGLADGLKEVFFRPMAEAEYANRSAQKRYNDEERKTWKSLVGQHPSRKTSDPSKWGAIGRERGHQLSMKERSALRKKIGTFLAALDPDGLATLEANLTEAEFPFVRHEGQVIRDQRTQKATWEGTVKGVNAIHKEMATPEWAGAPDKDAATPEQQIGAGTQKQAGPIKRPPGGVFARRAWESEYVVKSSHRMTPAERVMFDWYQQKISEMGKHIDDALEMTGKNPLNHIQGYYPMFRMLEGQQDGWALLAREAKDKGLYTTQVDEMIRQSQKTLARRMKGSLQRHLSKGPSPGQIVLPHGKHRVRSTIPIVTDVRSVYTSLMQNVMKFRHLEPAVHQLKQVLDHRDTAGVGIETVAPNSHGVINEWLKYQAGEQVLGWTQKGFGRVLDQAARKLTLNAHYSVLSGNLRTALIQFSAIRGALVVAGPRATAQALDLLMQDAMHWGIRKGMKRFGYEWKPERISEWQRTYDDSFFMITREGHRGGTDIGVDADSIGLRKLAEASTMYGKGVHALRTGKNTLGEIGFKPLEWADKMTTRWTRLAFELKGERMGLKGEELKHWADEWTMKVAGSTHRLNRTPWQRTSFGRMLTVFQNFNIADFNFMMNETLGLGREHLTPVQRVTRTLSYIFWTTATNMLYEDLVPAVLPDKAQKYVFGGGRFHSPFPTPIRTFMGGSLLPIPSLWDDKELQKIVNNGYGSFWKSKMKENEKGRPEGWSRAYQTIKEPTEILPALGGGLKYGSSPFGIVPQAIEDMTKALSGKKGAYNPFAVLGYNAMLLGGVPGLFQARKTILGATPKRKSSTKPQKPRKPSRRKKKKTPLWMQTLKGGRP